MRLRFSRIKTTGPGDETSACSDSTTVRGPRGRDCNKGIARERTNTGYSDYNALQAEIPLINSDPNDPQDIFFRGTTENSSEIFAAGAGVELIPLPRAD